ncbi:MAG: hypothetical protein IPI58_03380 [Alphaproteobacteria bacterium]|nr:MAG: hypothetical protein IPI58_03380 [Alphaproteobacteria bacterium]
MSKGPTVSMPHRPRAAQSRSEAPNDALAPNSGCILKITGHEMSEAPKLID